MTDATQHDPSAAGTTQTGDGSAGTINTGNGQGTQPAASGSHGDGAGTTAGAAQGATQAKRRTEDVELGIGIGVERATKKLVKRLGLDLDDGYTLDDVLASIAERKQPAAQQAPENGAGAGKILDHPEVQRLADEHAKAQARLKKLEAETAVLRGQADRAREVELSNLALGAKVGPGKQLEAFLRIYGDVVRYDASHHLQVMHRLADGTMIPSGQPVEEYVAAAVQESPWMRRIEHENASGSGSRVEPARSEHATGHDAWAEQMRAKMGLKPKT